MSTFFHDLRYASRVVTKSPVFTTVVVLTLALGIGLNTAVFSAIDALLLRPLPGTRNSAELVQLYRSQPGGMLYGSNSIPHFNDVRERSGDAFSSVALWSFQPVNLSSSERTQRLFAALASANYFKVLGVNMVVGRGFLAQEDSGRGAHAVTVLSYATWKELFNSDPNIVNRTVILNGQTYSVVGVAPPEFRGSLPVVAPALWVPLTQLAQISPGQSNHADQRGYNSFNVVARLKPGVSIARAGEVMKRVEVGLRADYPDHYKDSGIAMVLQSDAGIHPMFKSAQVELSTVVMAVVAMLLLIACMNVANLFLARARDRSREMAIRLSLGARRSDLIRQLLTESLLFATVAGVAGLILAWWVMGLANRIELPIGVNFSPDLHLSPMVLLFNAGVALLTGVLFGLAPALQATRPSLIPALKGEAAAGESRSRLSRGLVVTQMALSIILLVCAGLFLRDLKAATSVDKGFNASNLVLADLDPGLQGYDRARSEIFYRSLTERLRAMPSVRAVGFAATVPLGMSESDNMVTIPGYVPGPNENMGVQLNTVTPGYFESMGIPLLKGRGFTSQDDSLAPNSIVINQRFADFYFAGKEPIGQTVRTSGKDHTVVGVVPMGKYFRLGEPPTAFMYFAQAQHWNSGMTVHIRTAGDPIAIAPSLRSAVGALDPNLPVSDVRTMDTHLGITLLPARLAGAVLGIFGLLGLALASIGIYGVMAYSVAQRTREIGIRVAVGAAASDVMRLVMRQGLTMVLIGMAIGLGGALGATRLLRTVLYGSAGIDPVTFGLVPLLLLGVATLAIWIPARRASTVDPIVALRQQ